MNILLAIQPRMCLALFLLFCALPAVGSETASTTPPRDLYFLNWSDYIDPQLVEEFEQRYNAKVHILYFDSDDNRNNMLVETSGNQFDLAIVDGNSVLSYVRRGWLSEITAERIPNLRYIDAHWRNAYPGTHTYAVPYFWGTAGIVYRADLVRSPITTWMQLFTPEKSLQNKIYMLPQSRELIDIALRTLGYSVNTESPAAYQKARELLLAQRPFVKKYDVPAVDETSSLVQGTILAATTYNGDAQLLHDINPQIQYVNPSEGGILWVDYLVIFAKSKQKKLAAQFINFLNEPANGAQLARYVRYATPNNAAKKLLPKDFLKNPIIYPDKSIFDSLEFETPLPASIYKLRNTIFAEVTNGKI